MAGKWRAKTVATASCYKLITINYMLFVCAGVLSRRLFSWLMDRHAYSRSSCGVFGVVTISFHQWAKWC